MTKEEKDALYCICDNPISQRNMFGTLYCVKCGQVIYCNDLADFIHNKLTETGLKEEK
jgi:hypothetical protein